MLRTWWAGGRDNLLAQNALLVAGAAGVALSAYLHLHLWMTGYSAITTIGPLFLSQAVVGFTMSLAVLALRRVAAALAAAGLCLGTIAGFLLSVHVGLFGFRDAWTARDAQAALWDEMVSAGLLIAGATWVALRARRGEPALRRSEDRVDDGDAGAL